MAFSCAFSSGYSNAFAICPSVTPLDVPVQVIGGRGPVMRPDYDPIAGLRPDDVLIRDIRRIGDTLRRTVRDEVPV